MVGDIQRNSEVAMRPAETPASRPSRLCQRWRRTMSRQGIEPSSRRCGCQPVLATKRCVIRSTSAAALARLVLAPGKSPADLAAALAATDDIKVDATGARATPVDRAGEAGILVAGPWPAGSPGACWIWIVSDNLQAGAALNAVRIAETVWRRAPVAKGSA